MLGDVYRARGEYCMEVRPSGLCLVMVACEITNEHADSRPRAVDLSLTQLQLCVYGQLSKQTSYQRCVTRQLSHAVCQTAFALSTFHYQAFLGFYTNVFPPQAHKW